MNSVKILTIDMENCCGCGACRNACPNKAISMVPDANGFMYPSINLELCVRCGLCTRICAYKRVTEMKKPEASYVATNYSAETLQRSSSGGIFAALAKSVLIERGKVYGAAYVRDEQGIYVAHVGIDSVNDLWRLQGSKYVQSDISLTYQEAEEDLKAGKKVLFSGTPCQIDGLKGYLRKDYDHLFTVDIVCHGVPSRKLFDSYVNFLEKKYGGKIEQLEFRDKTKGWEDYFLRIDLLKGKRFYTKWVRCRLSAYYESFLSASILRKTCYSCKYACDKRCSDITLGDYWGIKNEHSELFVEDKWWERLYEGISCVLINSERGGMMLDKVKDEIDFVNSSFEKVSRNNGQLKQPSCYNAKREVLLEQWENGYERIEKEFKRTMGFRYYKYKVIGIIKPEFKRKIRRLIRKIRKK